MNSGRALSERFRVVSFFAVLSCVGPLASGSALRDVAALLTDHARQRLTRDQVGTVVETLKNGALLGRRSC
jgi:hypothetical protein